jgi:hypothetical protein
MDPMLFDNARILAATAHTAALMGSGQTPLLQGLLRQGLVGPLEDRMDEAVKGAATLLEPLAEEQAAELLALVLQQEGDRRVIRGPGAGVRLLFQSSNAGFGWVRLFRVEAPVGHPFRSKVTACMDTFAAYLAGNPSSLLYGMVGLPIGAALSLEAIKEHLAGTRWAEGHWMAAAYIPEKGGFAALGTPHTVFRQSLDGRAVVERGSALDTALAAEPDLDLLPARGFPTSHGALWGGEAIVEGVSFALQGSYRLDIQWSPIPYETIATPLNGLQSSPFWGAELGEATEVAPMGVLLPTPAQRILLAFEAPPEGVEGVGLGALDQPALDYLMGRFGVHQVANGQFVLPKAWVGQVLTAGMPIWNRLLRLSQSIS